MNENLLETIKSVGYWRINIRPSIAPDEPLLFGKCKDAVEKSRVSIRGWDFPHISYRNDDEGGFEYGSDFVENWTSWSGFNEFWRIYQSSQFLSYISLREDTNPMGGNDSDKGSLSVPGTIYQITEITEFCHRMLGQKFYEDGLTLKISLHNAKERHLSVGPRRMPFFPAHKSNSDIIELKSEMTSIDLKENYRKVAIDICIRLFDKFSWNPDFSQLQADQEGFYRQDWRY